MCAGDLHLDLDDLHRVGGDDLTKSGSGTGQHAILDRQLVLRDIGAFSPVLARKVVNGQLDGLFWSDSDQVGDDTTVQTASSFLCNDLAETIQAMRLNACVEVMEREREREDMIMGQPDE